MDSESSRCLYNDAAEVAKSDILLSAATS